MPKFHVSGYVGSGDGKQPFACDVETPEAPDGTADPSAFAASKAVSLWERDAVKALGYQNTFSGVNVAPVGD